MSIPEAAQLVIQASLMGKGGEIFVLDMGKPIKIINLARNIIQLSGMSLKDIKIQYTGLRPGEKLYEELLADNESTKRTSHEKLRIAEAVNVEKKWINSLLIWINSLKNKDEYLIKKELKNWLKEYNPKN
jgi:FlaA1/EpsC-like NDP-sugar epimerase